jgi:hypothetical protein
MSETNEISMQERLQLIESMIQEGRKSTDYWGWMFLLWGVAYFIAIGWTYYLPHPQYGWPLVMTATALAGALIGRGKRRRCPKPENAQSRALGGIWCATAAAIFLFAFSGALSGHSEPHTFLAGIEILIGVANAASAFTLRWRLQFLMALVWWGCGVASCFVAVEHLISVLILATLIGNIGFGLHLMRRETVDRARQVSHA